MIGRHVRTLDIQLEGIVVVVGNYGSGKTEVSINLAVYQRRRGVAVRIADLDLVNPYFRTREARDLMADMQIDLVLPPEEYLRADLPILSPSVAGMIRKPSQLTVLDVGGNDVGATVLAALADAFKGSTVHMLQVVNPMRPFTQTLEGCHEMRRKIEKAAKMTVSGLIGNANLIDETTLEDICSGYEFIKKLSADSGLPVEFITAEVEFLPQIDQTQFSCPILPIVRQLVPPWKKAKKI